MPSSPSLLSQILGCFNFRNNVKTLYIRESDRYAALDGIRAISILMVIMFHATLSIRVNAGAEGFQEYLDALPWFLSWTLQGEKGVDSFFVLSGFLIGSMLFKEGKNTGNIQFGRFYYRRFLRLSPMYWVLLLMMTAAPLTGDKTYIWANFFYLNNFLEGDQILAPWTWSLAVEEQFYMLFPLFLSLWFFKSNNKLLILISLYLLSFFIRYMLVISDQKFLTQNYVELLLDQSFFSVVYDNLYSRYGALVAGIIPAYLHHYHSEKLSYFFTQHAILANVLLALSLFAIAAQLSWPIYNWSGEDHASTTLIFHTTSRNLFALFVAYVLVAVLYGQALCSVINKFLSWRIWLPIAQLAYTLYLFHPVLVLPIEKAVSLSLGEGEPYSIVQLFQVSGLTLLSCLIFCSLTYVVIEKPFMNMRNVQWKKPGKESAIV